MFHEYSDMHILIIIMLNLCLLSQPIKLSYEVKEKLSGTGETWHNCPNENVGDQRRAKWIKETYLIERECSALKYILGS